MSAKLFIDTNVLVYAASVSGDQPEKTALAQSLVNGARFSLSTQVLGEFFCASTSRRQPEPLPISKALEWIRFWKLNDVHSITPPHVDFALELTQRFQIAYYDALILASARLAGCETVYSEDLNAGQDCGGVLVRNPFAAA